MSTGARPPRAPPAARGARGGFTLIEALVAFAVVAVLTLAVHRAVVTARAGIERTVAFATAEQVARDLLALPPEPGWLASGGVAGESFGRRWRIRAELLGLAVPRAAPAQGEGEGEAGAGGDVAGWRPLRVLIRVDTGGGVLEVETVRLLRLPVLQ